MNEILTWQPVSFLHISSSYVEKFNPSQLNQTTQLIPSQPSQTTQLISAQDVFSYECMYKENALNELN